jgi:hypothetical protein
MKLTATKSFTYGTRRLLPEAEFIATPRDAKILIGIGKAKLAVEPQKVDKPKRTQKRRTEEEDQHGLLE